MTTRKKPTQPTKQLNRPNPQAAAELYDRLLWFLATRELKKRAEQSQSVSMETARPPATTT